MKKLFAITMLALGLWVAGCGGTNPCAELRKQCNDCGETNAMTACITVANSGVVEACQASLNMKSYLADGGDTPCRNSCTVLKITCDSCKNAMYKGECDKDVSDGDSKACQMKIDSSYYAQLCQ